MRLVKTDGASTVVKYPYTIGDFKKEFPNVSLPPSPSTQQLAEFNLFRVTETVPPDPSDGITRTIIEVAPAFDGSVWVQTWGEEDASVDEQATRQAAADDVAAKAAIELDPFVATFIAMTPAEIETYIDANVTDLASARELFKKIGKMLLLLARREFR